MTTAIILLLILGLIVAIWSATRRRPLQIANPSINSFSGSDFLAYLGERHPAAKIRDTGSGVELLDVAGRSFQASWPSLDAISQKMLAQGADQPTRMAALAEVLFASRMNREQVLRRILPRFKPAVFFDNPRAKAELIHQPWLDTGLVMIYAIDNDQTVVLITREILQQLKMTLSELHELALHNLEAQTSPKNLADRLKESGSAQALMGSDYNAVRVLLLPKYLEPGHEVAAALVSDSHAVFLRIDSKPDFWKVFRELTQPENGSLMAPLLRISNSGISLGPPAQ